MEAKSTNTSRSKMSSKIHPVLSLLVFISKNRHDDGKFKLRTFGKENRTEEEIQANEVSINELIDINDFTMPNEELSDPFINCCFISDEKIFVALYHGYSMTHYHFVWNLTTKSMEDVAPF